MALEGRYTSPIHELGTRNGVSRLSNLAIEARRLQLLARRDRGTKDTVQNPNAISNHYSNKRDELNTRIANNEKSGFTDTYNQNYNNSNNIINDIVTIIDIDAEGPDQGLNYIDLPFIPKELNWNTESNFVAIKPVGRNNPKYHYTGSEDRLEFDIDWHSYNNKRDDVIRKCRLIESLSKNDGYENPPHRVILHWSNRDYLFRDIHFIVLSAPYKMTQFSKASYSNGNIISNGMLPIQATQKIVLGRITDHNLLSKEIQKYYSYGR